MNLEVDELISVWTELFICLDVPEGVSVPFKYINRGNTSSACELFWNPDLKEFFVLELKSFPLLDCDVYTLAGAIPKIQTLFEEARKVTDDYKKVKEEVSALARNSTRQAEAIKLEMEKETVKL